MKWKCEKYFGNSAFFLGGEGGGGRGDGEGISLMFTNNIIIPFIMKIVLLRKTKYHFGQKISFYLSKKKKKIVFNAQCVNQYTKIIDNNG